uniref:Uncharacterized protein n=1 Tax=Desulfacinum infernum TaxID=35837 RepID=A0A831ZZJ2_9BACT
MKVRLVLAIFVMCFSCAGIPALAAEPATGSSEARESAAVGADAEKWTGEAVRILEAMQSQQREMAQELRAVKREIAALKVALNEPGFKDIVGGIGYILGFFGIAFYLHARRRHQRSGP